MITNLKKTVASGFSLIEMLIVMSVIGLLLAMATPDLFSLVQSSSLGAEGSALRNRLTQAQQSALSTNSDVEVRFFKFADELEAQTKDYFRAYQFFKFDKSGELVPLSQLYRIKSPVVINSNLSTLVDGNAPEDGYLSPSTGDYEIPVGLDFITADYIAFRFTASGATDLPSEPESDRVWYVTLVQGEGAASSSQAPDNFYTVQVDPFNGRLTEFRP